MNTPSFEAVFDRCLDDVLSARQTVEACLSQWPQYADRLEGPLRTAAALRSLPAPDPALRADRRAEFMAALRSTPQQSRRRFRLHLPALPFPSPILLAPATAIAAVALLLIVSRPFGSTSTAEAATLTTFGTVERAEAGEWQNVPDNAAISEGDHLRTAADASAVLTFPDGTTLTLDPSTEVILERAYRGAKQSVQLRQLAGRVWGTVAASGTSALRLQTVDAVVVAARSSSFETTMNGGETAISAPEGNVEVQAADERMVSTPGDLIRARLGQRLVRSNSVALDRGIVVQLTGPLVASLISPRGLATGATPDGFVFRQIPGTLTTDPGATDAEGQRIIVLVPVEGTYTLLLRRTGDGSGSAVVRAAGAEQRIEVPAAAPAFIARLRVTGTGSSLSVQLKEAQSVSPARIERAERLVLSEGARRRAVEILRALRERR